MTKISIAFFSLLITFATAPFLTEAQTAESQAMQIETAEQAALRQIALQLAEVEREVNHLKLLAAKLAQIALQLEGVEREVNHLALLVQKVALERQAEELQKRLAATLVTKEAIAKVPAEEQNMSIPEIAVEEEQGEPAEDLFAQLSPPAGLEDDSFESDQDSMSREEKDEKESIFAAALGSIKNMGTPQLAALTILAILAVFVLVRKMRGRKQGSVDNTQVSKFPSSQTLSQPQQDLLQEGRQDLKENVVWK